VLFGEACVIGFFALLAWTGWQLLQVLQGLHLVSLPWVPVQLTQSVIPIGAALFIVAQLLSLPEVLRRARHAAPSPAHTPGPVEERAAP
jgi:TRAP-type C4-dicarboxylate transport system permease small subunit